MVNSIRTIIIIWCQCSSCNKHILNIIKDGELDNSTISILEKVQFEGERQVKRKIKLYNLDMIISVGYRVKSQRGIIFRRWANKVLKEYLIQGYSINIKRLEKLNKAIVFLKNNILSLLFFYDK